MWAYQPCPFLHRTGPRETSRRMTPARDAADTEHHSRTKDEIALSPDFRLGYDSGLQRGQRHNPRKLCGTVHPQPAIWDQKARLGNQLVLGVSRTVRPHTQARGILAPLRNIHLTIGSPETTTRVHIPIATVRCGRSASIKSWDMPGCADRPRRGSDTQVQRTAPSLNHAPCSTSSTPFRNGCHGDQKY